MWKRTTEGEEVRIVLRDLAERADRDVVAGCLAKWRAACMVQVVMEGRSRNQDGRVSTASILLDVSSAPVARAFAGENKRTHVLSVGLPEGHIANLIAGDREL